MKPNELRRYTNLPSVLQMLQTNTITLLTPDIWDDVNDRRLIEAYRVSKGYSTVLALCFSAAAETYHHWRTFSHGTDGMCVVFDKDKLLSRFKQPSYRHKPVSYYSVQRLSEHPPVVSELPFSKRIAYKPEKEYRLLHLTRDEKIRHKNVEIEADAILRVIINPWLVKQLAQSVSLALKSIEGREDLDVRQSTVVDGPAWKNLADKFTNIDDD